MNKTDILEKLEKYKFYHIIKLDEGIYTPGIKNFVPHQQIILNALRDIPLEGKRVLDIGCRDGLFCFEAEKLGAQEVIGIDNDLSPAATEFLIPYFNSKVKMFNLNVYDLTPDRFGKFDVVIFAGVLYHLRYPFWVLKLLKDVMADDGTLIIETGILDMKRKHALLYCPIGEESPYEATSIAFFNIKGLTDTLYSLGLKVENILYLKKKTLISRFRFILKCLPSFLLEFFVKDDQKLRHIKNLPTKRATLTCTISNTIKNKGTEGYWDSTHKYHTTGKL